MRSGYASVSASSVASSAPPGVWKSSPVTLVPSPGATGERTYVRKSIPVDELHGEEPKLAVGNQVVEGHQIGVGNIGQGAELLLEAEQRRGVRPLHRLERDSSVASAVVSLVDDSHAAAAHLAEDHIAEPRQVLFRDGVQR